MGISCKNMGRIADCAALPHWQDAHMTSFLTGVVLYVEASVTTQVFLLSTLVLLLALLLKVHRDAFHVRFLDAVPLNRIELEQMHIPSLRVIVAVVLCAVAFLAVGLWALSALTNDNGNAYWWLSVAAVFVLLLACGVLAEIRWKRARDYLFSCVLGTAAALGLLLAYVPQSGALALSLHGATVAAVVAVAWRLLRPAHSLRVLLTAAAVFLLWTGFFFL